MGPVKLWGVVVEIGGLESGIEELFHMYSTEWAQSARVAFMAAAILPRSCLTDYRQPGAKPLRTWSRLQVS